jgi:hypothetical protein
VHQDGRADRQVPDKLFADPVTVDTPSGMITIYPQSTNNIVERFFRDERHGHRRKTGNDSMHRALQAMLTDTPLVKNAGYSRLREDPPRREGKS